MEREGGLRVVAAVALRAVALAAIVGLAGGCGTAAGDNVLLATGTTVYDSGLLDVLEPAYEEATGFDLKVVSVGTGQALEMGRRGDVDVVLTHAPTSEAEFVAEGAGVNRQLVMHNDFIIVGPADDPAAVRTVRDAADALKQIAAAGEPFISRGDDSGTHKRELALWAEQGEDPTGASWYGETGDGMGATLQVANQREAYTISDRGTYLALKDDLELEIVLEGDPALLNVYHVTQVNPARHEDVNDAGGRALLEFLVSDEAQAIIADFGVEEFGRPLFIPDAGKSEEELTQ